jgi:hypothetical protein
MTASATKEDHFSGGRPMTCAHLQLRGELSSCLVFRPLGKGDQAGQEGYSFGGKRGIESLRVSAPV